MANVLQQQTCFVFNSSEFYNTSKFFTIKTGQEDEADEYLRFKRQNEEVFMINQLLDLMNRNDYKGLLVFFNFYVKKFDLKKFFYQKFQTIQTCFFEGQIGAGKSSILKSIKTGCKNVVQVMREQNDALPTDIEEIGKDPDAEGTVSLFSFGDVDTTCVFIEEPVKFWQHVVDCYTGKNMLQIFYDSLKITSGDEESSVVYTSQIVFKFQIFVLFSKLFTLYYFLNNVVVPGVTEKIVVERSVYSDYFVFFNTLERLYKFDKHSGSKVVSTEYKKLFDMIMDVLTNESDKTITDNFCFFFYER